MKGKLTLSVPTTVAGGASSKSPSVNTLESPPLTVNFVLKGSVSSLHTSVSDPKLRLAYLTQTIYYG
jgi:hypothetical protein